MPRVSDADDPAPIVIRLPEQDAAPRFDAADLADLARAKQLLENPGLAIRLTAALGTPIERGLARLPRNWAATLENATRTALERSLQLATGSLDPRYRLGASDRLHRLAVTASGAAGGAFGIAGLSWELPLTTTLMLRSIAAIGRAEGERLHTPDAQLACLQVFALGGRGASDDAGETGYYAVRVLLARLLSEASEHLARYGAGSAGAPAVLRLLTAVAGRFGVVVSEKAAAQALPVIGAASGALINNLFIEHFQAMARGHFIVRRLERRHGAAAVRLAYERL